MTLRHLFAIGLLSASAATALAASPSAVLPLPTLRSSLPISVASTSAPAAAASTATQCDRHRVMSVDSGKAKAIPDGFALDIYGQSQAAGWKTPQLVLADQDHGVATVDFVGCSPETSAQVVTPVETHMALGLDPSTRRIVVRSRTTTVTIDVSH